MDGAVSVALAALAVVLFGVALVAMAQGDLMIAGLSFLSASVVIFLRESRGEDAAGAGAG